MIKLFSFLLPFSLLALCAEELKVVSENFKGDQQKGISVFTGNVKVTKGQDDLNASKVTIYTDAQRKPVKYVAEGDVSFYIVTELKEIYKGKSQTAVYYPNESEYHFYKKVDLIRIDDFRRVQGDKVVVNTIKGEAVAESTKGEPVIMVFTLEEKEKKPKAKAK